MSPHDLAVLSEADVERHFSMHCGRLDDHDEHDWTTPPSARWPKPVRPYYCSGRVLIEGGWFGSDAQDDAAEERAMTERRETA